MLMSRGRSNCGVTYYVSVYINFLIIDRESFNENVINLKKKIIELKNKLKIDKNIFVHQPLQHENENVTDFCSFTAERKEAFGREQYRH